MRDENHLYEYAVIRYVPHIEREEFINVGLVMLCKRKKWLRVRLYIIQVKLDAFMCGDNRAVLEKQLQLFSAIGEGNPAFGKLATMEPEERFRWLTAVKSSCIQTSRPHPGLSSNLDATFEHLFSELIL